MQWFFFFYPPPACSVPFCQRRWFKIQNYYPPARHSLKSERPAAAANSKYLPHVKWLKLFIETKERRRLYFFVGLFQNEKYEPACKTNECKLSLTLWATQLRIKLLPFATSRQRRDIVIDPIISLLLLHFFSAVGELPGRCFHRKRSQVRHIIKFFFVTSHILFKDSA